MTSSSNLIPYHANPVVSAMIDPSSELVPMMQTLSLLEPFERSVLQCERTPKDLSCRDLCTLKAPPKRLDSWKTIAVQNFIASNPALQSELDSRTLQLMQQVRTKATSMGIPEAIMNSMHFCFDKESLGSPFVEYPNSESNYFTLHIPLLFLVNLDDISNGNEICDLVKKVYELNPDENLMNAFKDFLVAEKSGVNIKSFMLLHELAHIANDDSQTLLKHKAQGAIRNSRSLEALSQKFEKRADLTAANFMGHADAQAGIGCMRTMEKYSLSEDLLHPSGSKRLNYLTKYAKQGDPYLWKQVEKMQVYVGNPDLITKSPFSTSPSREIVPFSPHHASCSEEIENYEEIIGTEGFFQIEDLPSDTYISEPQIWDID